jgi:hypothetical protein
MYLQTTSAVLSNPHDRSELNVDGVARTFAMRRAVTMQEIEARCLTNKREERIGVVLDVTECEHRPEAGAPYAS